MWYFIYYATGIIILPGLLFALFAQFKVNSTFKKYNKVQTLSGESASKVAYNLLKENNCPTLIEHINGNLTDNYNPKTKVLSLSNATYNNSSVAAVGVAAHEVGHATQDNDGYFLLKLRSFIVPFVNIGSYLAFPLAILGIVLEFASNLKIANLGTILIVIGIILYSLSTIFSLITLPVELNASSRALKMLIEGGHLTESEKRQAKKVLTAAALTYVASLAVSLLYLLRFIILILNMRRKD